MEGVRRLVLIGLSGVGKSTVGRLVADRLGWRAVDTDTEIEMTAGLSVPEIFRERGEGAFRQLERAALRRALAEDDVVIASGGGAAVAEDAWSSDALARPGTLVVALDADPAISFNRLRAQAAIEGGVVERPLLAGDDPLTRLAAMKANRQASYDRAPLTLTVDATPPEIVAAELARLVTPDARGDPDIVLETASSLSQIRVAEGLFAQLGTLSRDRWPNARRAWIVTDMNVGPILGPRAVAALEHRGFDVRLRSVAPGEVSKSVRGIGGLWDWMLGGGIERSELVVALGGGVIGDLAGFAAASVLRGVGLVQVPTTLQAMVDASVGGKTGINHAAGKNLIGAFYQPGLVVIDPALLRTVPERELRAGWSEVVKHAVIQPSTPGGERADLLPFIERNAARLQGLAEPATSYLIRRNVALKAAVVAADERESGIRAYLNFGHTLGHAIEASDYALLHGEAVALGMRAAARIGESVGTCGAEVVDRIDGALDRFGLPATAMLDPASVLARIGSDKKRSRGRLRWVLPLAEGGVAIRDDVQEAVVREALDAVRSPDE